MNQIVEKTKDQLIDSFRNYLAKQTRVKQATLKDIESMTCFDSSSIEWYKGQIVELDQIKRCFELIVLGEKEL